MNRLIFCVVIIVLLISCSKDVAPLVPPAAPSDLKTVLYPNEVGVEWTVNSTTELGFNVERKTGTSDYTLCILFWQMHFIQVAIPTMTFCQVQLILTG